MSFVLSYNDNINNEISDEHQIKKECRKQIISMILKNAMNMGWNVEKNEKNVYTLRKKENQLSKNEKNTSKLVDMFFDINKF
jgi:hypothetical protein